MQRGVRKYLVGSIVLVALIGVAGCTHYFFAEREPWRHEAELACLDSGVAEEIPGRVRISAIEGPGACGIDYPLKVSEVGESGPLNYDDAPPIPPGAIPESAQPPWPVVRSDAPAPLPQNATSYGQPAVPPASYTPLPPSDVPQDRSQYPPPPYGRYGQAPPQYGAQSVPQSGAPMSLDPSGVAPADDDLDAPSGPPHPYDGSANAVPASAAPGYDVVPLPRHDEPARVGSAPVPRLGPPESPTATAEPVGLRPAATLACPIVSTLDKWIATAVQPAALKWFRQPVVEIRQIGSYSCRGMNGNPNAHISEHAFGNALDIAEFDLADGHRVSVQYGWRGTPEEQGFLHDVQLAACRDFTTVLAPGANIYHYNHIHVDLMRRSYPPYICEPAAIPGEIAAARARAHYAAYGYGGITGSIGTKPISDARAAAPEDDDRLPPAVPGDD
jgi:hypothetical protein